MAYPDYSIVIISITTNGVTVDYANAFYNDELAKAFYKKAISDGNRAFYYEKPKPSKFSRNDAQPLKVNDEVGSENVPIPAVTTEQKIGEVVEFIRRGTAPVAIANAFGVQEQIDSQLFTLGEKTYEVWKNFNNFLRRALIGTTYTPYGTVVFQVTKSNKRVTFRADGEGQFLVPPDIEKLWPDKDETEDSAPSSVNIVIETSIISIGTKIVRKTFGGMSAMDFTSEEFYTFIPSGEVVMETDSTIYRSDGQGGVNSEPKDDGDEDCPPAGTNLGVDPSDSCYDLIADGNCGTTQQSNGSCDGGEDCPPAGTNLGVDPSDSCYDLIADGSCGTTQVSNGSCDGGGDEYPPAGTDLGVDPSDSCYNLIADGSGGATQQSNGSCDGGDNGGGDNGGGGDDCPSYGTLVSENNTDATIYIGEVSGDYIAGTNYSNTYADGTCGTYNETGINWYSEGTELASDNAYNYLSNGNGGYYAVSNGNTDDNGGGEDGGNGGDDEGLPDGPYNYPIDDDSVEVVEEQNAIDYNGSGVFEANFYDVAGNPYTYDSYDIESGDVVFPAGAPQPAHGDWFRNAYGHIASTGRNPRLYNTPIPNGYRSTSAFFINNKVPTLTSATSVSVQVGWIYSGRRRWHSGHQKWIPESFFPNSDKEGGVTPADGAIIPNQVLCTLPTASSAGPKTFVQVSPNPAYPATDKLHPYLFEDKGNYYAVSNGDGTAFFKVIT